METNNNQKDLEACLRTFRRLAYKIDEMNSKLTHIIEDLREVYLRKSFEEPYSEDTFFEEYNKHDQPDDDDLLD
jgi:hypothetical protein